MTFLVSNYWLWLILDSGRGSRSRYQQIPKDAFVITTSRLGRPAFYLRGFKYRAQNSERYPNKYWHCTSIVSKSCRARGIMNEDGSLQLYEIHSHPPMYWKNFPKAFSIWFPYSPILSLNSTAQSSYVNLNEIYADRMHWNFLWKKIFTFFFFSLFALKQFSFFFSFLFLIIYRKTI